MNLTIENPISYQAVDNSNGDWQDCKDEYFALIQTIASVNDVQHLRQELNANFTNLQYFIYGFGGHHFWVSQKHSLGKIVRIIIVPTDK